MYYSPILSYLTYIIFVTPPLQIIVQTRIGGMQEEGNTRICDDGIRE